MSKPWIHSLSSAKRYGGIPEDYMPIHQLMDSSKAAMGDNRHRALTHNSWFIGTILERVFGATFTNSAGRVVSVRDVGEQHVLEDYGCKFIPSAQDFLQEMEFKDWMQNGRGVPPSFCKIEARKTRKVLGATNGIPQGNERRTGNDLRESPERRGGSASSDSAVVRTA